MPELCPAPPRADLVRLVRDQLTGAWPALRPLAEDLLAAETAIDWVAVDAEGSAVAVLVGEAGRDLELVARALAHRAWLAPRLRGLLALAGGAAGVRPGAPVRALALCPAFGPEAVAAAAAAGGAVALGLVRCLRDGAGLHALLEPLDPAPAAAVRAAEAPPRGGSAEPFRTRLTDADLELGPAEPERLAAPARR